MPEFTQNFPFAQMSPFDIQILSCSKDPSALGVLLWVT